MMVKSTVVKRRWLALGMGLLALMSMAPARQADEIRITVVAIHASDRNKDVDDELKEIAEKVSKVEPKLTGFKKGRTTTMVVAVGAKEDFPLGEDQVATVTLESPGKKDKEMVKLTVKPPMVGAITYRTTCDKFFPIVTRYQTKNNDRLIIAVMVERK